MRKKLKIGAIAGLAFSGASIAIVKLFGFTQNSFTALAYLYIILAVGISVYYEMDHRYGGIYQFLDNLVYVAEEEEARMRKILSGEKYKIKGKIERV